ncbi:slightly ste11-like protein [Marasmius crinis-equi]|uniref:Slightly ste11-like protein n=1 Tax=Marasmius crinis-equi TaxID=585013 RepID=A0ABR3F829_9AGAR
MSKTQKARIPRPQNAWNVFLADFCGGRKGGVSSGKGASKAASRRWNEMTKAEKAVYVGKAQTELEEHQIKYPDYAFNRMKKGKRPSKMTRVAEALGFRYGTTSKNQEAKIPGPRNVWIIFLTDFCKGRKGVVSSGKRASQAGSRQWKEMTKVEKAVYVGKAQTELKEHRMKYPDYVFERARRAVDGSGSRRKKGRRPSKMAMVAEALGHGTMSKIQEAKIPRPRNAWNIFLTDFCEGRKDVVSSRERASRAGSRRWNKMTKAEQAIYAGRAQIELEEYRSKYPEYGFEAACRTGHTSGSRRSEGKPKPARMEEACRDETNYSGYGLRKASSVSPEKDAMIGPSPLYQSEPAIPQTTSASEGGQSCPLELSDNFPSTNFYTDTMNADCASSSMTWTPNMIPSFLLRHTNGNFGYWFESPKAFEDQSVGPNTYEQHTLEDMNFPSLEEFNLLPGALGIPLFPGIEISNEVPFKLSFDVASDIAEWFDLEEFD